ncbi:gamma-soluble NSF attachment protein isoform X1 [Drosophila mauritiana]|uniref:Gamma-soluble NSF attachment protein n=1 Tax=Drosophila mauritiana TaxID=7226 RepID=A0A6P8KJ44_DROMA|nr:gamma-soluble NSF attachment protein isoform X1 [Drosophila mauritiana]
MSTLDAKKIEEAEALIGQTDSAANEYAKAGMYFKAATAYRVAKSFDKSKDCFLKAIDCYENNKSWFHAAKSYEQIILLAKETDKLSEVEDYANRACCLYQQHGSPEAAAAAMDKAAKMTESKHPDLALGFYKRALAVVLIGDSTHQASEFASKVSRILVRLKKYEEATKALKKEISLNLQTKSYGQVGRLVVALILVQLTLEDYVDAKKTFKKWGNRCDPQEVNTLQNLLKAFDDEDPELATKMLASPFIRHMDVEYALLSKDVPLPQGNRQMTKNGIDNAAN